MRVTFSIRQCPTDRCRDGAKAQVAAESFSVRVPCGDADDIARRSIPGLRENGFGFAARLPLAQSACEVLPLRSLHGRL
jgi:hypothetical protein